MCQQNSGYAIPVATTRWLDEREAHLWRTWLRVNQELPSVLEAQIGRDGGLSGADYAVLVPLSESPEGMLRSRELGREILWDRSRLSHHLNRMEKRGLVTREDLASYRVIERRPLAGTYRGRRAVTVDFLCLYCRKQRRDGGLRRSSRGRTARSAVDELPGNRS